MPFPFLESLRHHPAVAPPNPTPLFFVAPHGQLVSRSTTCRDPFSARCEATGRLSPVFHGISSFNPHLVAHKLPIFMIFMIFMILILKIIIFQKPLNPSLNPSTNPPYQPAWFPQILQSWGEPRGLTPWPPQADFPVATLGRCVTTFCASAACLRRCCSAASLRELSLGFFRSYTVEAMAAMVTTRGWSFGGAKGYKWI